MSSPLEQTDPEPRRSRETLRPRTRTRPLALANPTINVESMELR
jgi:hypothetical protein